MKFQKNDAVFCNVMNPATGHIKKVAKDQSWADVEWHCGVKCTYTMRTPTRMLIHLLPVLNKHLGVDD
jgi:hypothetical protein